MHTGLEKKAFRKFYRRDRREQKTMVFFGFNMNAILREFLFHFRIFTELIVIT